MGKDGNGHTKATCTVLKTTTCTYCRHSGHTISYCKERKRNVGEETKIRRTSSYFQHQEGTLVKVVKTSNAFSLLDSGSEDDEEQDTALIVAKFQAQKQKKKHFEEQQKQVECTQYPPLPTVTKSVVKKVQSASEKKKKVTEEVKDKDNKAKIKKIMNWADVESSDEEDEDEDD
jgi:hypothetical protein